MAKGKNIQLFLMDGTASGRIKSTLSNWTGVVYKIPRTMLKEAAQIPALQQTGVYFLFGADELTGEPLVYVGQAAVRKNGKGLVGRWEEHARVEDKSYWTEAVGVTTSNDSFGNTEISYLEHRFCLWAKAANRYIVKNGNEPSAGNITEEKESELEEFMEYAKLVLGALGYKLFEPLAARPEQAATPPIDAEPILHMEEGVKGVRATGQRTADGFVVFVGSVLAKDLIPSAADKVRRDREKYRDKIGDDSVLQADVLFQSPSGAASFVAGGNRNGNDSWKDERGLSLKELLAQEKI